MVEERGSAVRLVMQGNDDPRSAEADRGRKLWLVLVGIAVLAVAIGMWVMVVAVNPELQNDMPRILRSILRII